jgi:hypothetical protein
MQDAIQHYWDVRTANALDLTVEQVQTTNRLQRDAEDPANHDPMSYALPPQPFKVTDITPRGNVEFEGTFDGIFRQGTVLPSGEIDWGWAA